MWDGTKEAWKDQIIQDNARMVLSESAVYLCWSAPFPAAWLAFDPIAIWLSWTTAAGGSWNLGRLERSPGGGAAASTRPCIMRN